MSDISSERFALPRSPSVTGGNAAGATSPSLRDGEDREPANHFSRDKQVRFLEALALWGGVRAACRAVPASPQTVYRHRRASVDFALAWDAALLVARPHVEDVLADRALNGIEEVVWYHGEEIGRRRRYDSRLLLAHLARLDKVEECDQLAAIAHGFDEALDRLRAGKRVDPCEPDDDDDEDGAGEPAVYGERWEDETLPFPERAELYREWLEAEDEEFGEDGPDPYDIDDDPDDDLPDPYDIDDDPDDDLPDPYDPVDDEDDAPALTPRSGSAKKGSSGPCHTRHSAC